jgi:hypothetical protein
LFTQGGAAPLLKELDQLTSATPVLWLTASAEVLGDDPSTWDQAFSGAAWSRWRATVAAPTVGNRLTPVEDTAIAAPAAPIVERRSDGALMLDDLIIRLERGIEVISVNCQNRNGEVLWRQRWRPAAFLAAPSQTIDVRDGLVLVVEGGLRLSAFALAHGVRRAAFTLDDFGAGTPYVIGDHLAVIGPLGVDTSVTLIDARGMTRTIPLSNPARWAVPLGTSLLIASQDGSALLMPQGTAVQLPSELLRSRQAPQATPNGLLLGQRLWRWLR